MILYILSLIFITIVTSCSDFQLTSDDGAILCGRTMDFPIQMNAEVLVFNRDVNMSSTAPDNSVGLRWTSKYGFVGINAFEINLVTEGMNEMGLTCAYLVLTDSVYPNIVNNKNNISLAITDFCMWVLSLFSSVDEVVENINNIRIWGDKVPVLNMLFGLHVPIHDSFGNNIVIEFINGKVMIYNNTLGVLTNDPPFEFQLQNLAQYNELTSDQVDNAKINEYTVMSAPGSGLHDLSGGFSPIDRFVRLATLIRFADNLKTANDTLLAATHIIGSLYVMHGLEKGILPHLGRVSVTTEWATVKDLTNRVFYYIGNDGVIHAIYFDKLNFDFDAKHKPLRIQQDVPFVIDETEYLF